jgi:hypothetical protein
MSTEHEDRLLDEIRAARPTAAPSAQDWVTDERGQRVLARVVAAGDARTSAAAVRSTLRRSTPWRGRWWTGPHVAIAAAVLVLVVLAVSLPLVFAGRVADQGKITEDSHTTVLNPGAAGAGDQVTKLSAVEHLMPLLHLKTGESLESIGNSMSTVTIPVMEEAVARGLLTPGEVSRISASPMTQGEYAVLLSKAFVDSLPQVSPPTLPISPGATSEERLAIEKLQQAGVIRKPDGVFEPGAILTSEQESRLLTRIEETLNARIAH